MRVKIDGQFDNIDTQFKALIESLSTTRKMLHDTPQRIGLTTTRAKTLKLSVPKDYTSRATTIIPNSIVFLIRPKTTKNKNKNTSVTYMLQKNTKPILTPRSKIIIIIVFLILPNKYIRAQKTKYTQNGPKRTKPTKNTKIEKQKEKKPKKYQQKQKQQ